jgi:hypothetical protein
MAKYSSSGSQTLTTSIVTALGITSNTSTVQRNWIYEFVLANVGTPADLVSLHTIQRTTAPGNATPVTATKMDLADRVAQAVVGEDHSGEPTYTSNEQLFEIGLNHRATYKWQAAPGSELVLPATSGDGVGFGATHASATTDWRVGALHYE